MLADNLGYGDLGVYGGGETRGAPTPRIDKLANERIRFTQFLVESGCTPSRAASLTFRYLTEYDAKARFEGDLFVITIAKGL